MISDWESDHLVDGYWWNDLSFHDNVQRCPTVNTADVSLWGCGDYLVH
jgi:hypothetical protein